MVRKPTRPWTLGKGGPPHQPPPSDGNAASNPRRIGESRATRVGLMHSSALGADGRIYFGGFGLRSYTGGGLGWYDPRTGESDGFWEPLSGYQVHWIAPALGGQLIVISTTTAVDERNEHRRTDEAKLLVYDVTTEKIVREIVPVAQARATGLIAETAPGRLSPDPSSCGGFATSPGNQPSSANSIPCPLGPPVGLSLAQPENEHPA